MRDASQQDAAVRLRSEGLTHEAIAAQLHVSVEQARDWAPFRSQEGARETREAIKLAVVRRDPVQIAEVLEEHGFSFEKVIGAHREALEAKHFFHNKQTGDVVERDDHRTRMRAAEAAYKLAEIGGYARDKQDPEDSRGLTLTVSNETLGLLQNLTGRQIAEENTDEHRLPAPENERKPRVQAESAPQPDSPDPRPPGPGRPSGRSARTNGSPRAASAGQTRSGDSSQGED